ncbi:hypothetical protein KUV28_02880 [Ferrimonas balearica]|nr:hypothetical protein [Ferrimonas balearica]
MIDETSRNSLARNAVFLGIGCVWLGCMGVMIKISFYVSKDLALSGIMSFTGDIATVIGFAMVYFRNPFFDKLKLSGGIDGSTEARKQIASTAYDLISYVIAWHAVAAIILRGDFLYHMIGGHAKSVLTFVITFAFGAAGIISIKGYRNARRKV